MVSFGLRGWTSPPGTGFFRKYIKLKPLQPSYDLAIDLKSVRVIKRDALNTGLAAASIGTALLFGALPWPVWPLNLLLPEMHRVLKPEGE